MDLSSFEQLDIVLVCGLPGSGKSHFATHFFKDSDRKRINRKEIRKALYEMTNFGKTWTEEHYTETDEHLVQHVERRIFEHLLQNGQRLLIDNTSVSVSSRSTYVKMAQQLKKSIGVIFLNIPFPKCLERNRGRDDSVSEMVISKLSAAVELPSQEEGFRRVLTIENY